jgi:hypothetical protein
MPAGPQSDSRCIDAPASQPYRQSQSGKPLMRAALHAVRVVDRSCHTRRSSAVAHYRMRARPPRGVGCVRPDAYADDVTDSGSPAVTAAAAFAIMAG